MYSATLFAYLLLTFVSCEDFIIELDSQELLNTITDSSHMWIVEFHTTSSERLDTAMVRASNVLKGIIKFASIDCEEDEGGLKLAQHYGVTEYPTLLFFSRNLGVLGVQVPPKSPKAIMDFVVNVTASEVALISDSDTYLEFVNSAAGTPSRKVLLFTEKLKTTLLYKSLSIYFKERLAFGEVKNYPSLADGFGIEQWPTLMVLGSGSTGGQTHEIYEGVLHFDSIIEFLERFADPAPARTPMDDILSDKPSSTPPTAQQAEDSQPDNDWLNMLADQPEFGHEELHQTVDGVTFKEVNGMIFNAHALTEEEVDHLMQGIE
eukprot:TRINITY_DN61443_c0_g1_i1.p1 TRINITY_DN61443_c0_g1~~TRINITY_DN61443_c0_g1_i1.p1  ORF type:complete len:320 (+),score=32.52 TRINITY_DN61443_c0_g1_i1:39-998(+)